MDKLGFVRYLALLLLLLLKKYTLCYNLKVTSGWPAEPKHLLNNAVFPWLIVSSPRGYRASFMPHLTIKNPVSSSQTACHSAQWMPWQLGNAFALLSSRSATSTVEAYHMSRGQCNTTPTKWARQARRCLVACLCTAWKADAATLQHNDERWASVCFLQRVWTVAVFLVASAMQGYRHRTFTQRLTIWFVISENLSWKKISNGSARSRCNENKNETLKETLLQ